MVCKFKWLVGLFMIKILGLLNKVLVKSILIFWLVVNWFIGEFYFFLGICKFDKSFWVLFLVV